MLRDMLRPEIDFYDFIVQRLKNQAKTIGLWKRKDKILTVTENKSSLANDTDMVLLLISQQRSFYVRAM